MDCKSIEMTRYRFHLRCKGVFMPAAITTKLLCECCVQQTIENCLPPKISNKIYVYNQIASRNSGNCSVAAIVYIIFIVCNCLWEAKYLPSTRQPTTECYPQPSATACMVSRLAARRAKGQTSNGRALPNGMTQKPKLPK